MKCIRFVDLHRVNFNPKEPFLSALHTLHLTVSRELFIFQVNKEKSYPVMSKQSGRQRRPMKVSPRALKGR